MSAISLAGVGKRYLKYADAPLLLTAALRTRTRRSDLWALRGADLEVAPGERLGVVGRNGAGKSTLLQLVAGVTAPTEGVVRVRGRVAPLISVGVGFHPELTGRENVYVNGAVLGLSRSQVRSRFDAIVDFAEVEDFLDTPVKFYSSGMYVRLGFAVAAQADPDVLVVDEVLAVGDLAFQMKCADRMAEVAAQGTTVVVVSHDLRAVRALCARSLLVDGGRIALDGPTPQVLEAYHHALALPPDREAGEVDAGAPVVVDADLLGADGRPSRSVAVGEEVVLRFTTAYPTGATSVVHGLTVRTAEGEPVYADSTLWEPVAEVAAGTTTTCEVRFRAQLPTGSYTVVGGVQTGAYAGPPEARTGTAGGQARRAASPPLLFFVAGRDTVTGRADLQGGFTVTAGGAGTGGPAA